jgi:hypothetical protein
VQWTLEIVIVAVGDGTWLKDNNGTESGVFAVSLCSKGILFSSHSCENVFLLDK